MAAFSYEAQDSQGKTITGTLDADSAKAARASLRARQLVPVVVQEITRHGAGRTVWGLGAARPVMAPAALAVWTRQLASLVDAGLNIERALNSLGDEADGELQRHMLADLVAQVKAGSAFSEALRSYPQVFDPVFCAVVAAGERSGSLAQVLNGLAQELEAAQELKAKVLGAALYPVIVSAIAVLIVVFLMTYVLPQVAGAFASSQRSLPWLTQFMLACSAFLRQAWWALFLCGLGVGMGLRQALRHERTRLRLHAGVLRLPWMGKLVRNYNTARFSSTLGMLSVAGLPILAGLQAASNTLGNAALRHDMDEVRKMVREGVPLGLALAQKPRFPRLVATFARMGAETGNLGPMLTRVGQQLATEVQRRAMHLASVLEPLLILAMGVVVLLIVLAVLMPIIQLNSFVQ